MSNVLNDHNLKKKAHIFIKLNWLSVVTSFLIIFKAKVFSHYNDLGKSIHFEFTEMCNMLFLLVRLQIGLFLRKNKKRKTAVYILGKYLIIPSTTSDINPRPSRHSVISVFLRDNRSSSRGCLLLWCQWVLLYPKLSFITVTIIWIHVFSMMI